MNPNGFHSTVSWGLQKSFIILLALIFLHSPAHAAVQFSGGRAYISVPAHPDFDIQAPMTAAGWIKRSGKFAKDNIFWQRSHKSAKGWAFCIEHDKLVFIAFDKSGDLLSNYDFKDTEWHHVAFVRTDDACWKMYIDGKLDNEGCGMRGSAPCLLPLYVGANLTWMGEPREFSDAALADVAIWNTALSAKQIKFLAQARGKDLPAHTARKYLKLFLPLSDHPSGTPIDGKVFKDLSGLGHDGTGSDSEGKVKVVE